MSWRRFLVLVRGLSINSSLVRMQAHGAQAGKQEVRTMETPEQAQRAFVSIFGGLKRPNAPHGAARATRRPPRRLAEKTPTH